MLFVYNSGIESWAPVVYTLAAMLLRRAGSLINSDASLAFSAFNCSNPADEAKALTNGHPFLRRPCVRGGKRRLLPPANAPDFHGNLGSARNLFRTGIDTATRTASSVLAADVNAVDQNRR